MSHTAKLKEAVNQHQSGQLEDAEGLYRQVLSEKPNDADALHMLGLLSYQKGKPELAVDLISRSLEINPGFPPAMMNLGNALLATKDFSNAEAMFRRASADRNSETDALLGVAISLFWQERHDKAIECLDRLLKTDPNNAAALFQTGQSYRALEKHSAAREFLSKAIELNPNVPHWLICRSQTSQFLAEYESAEADCRRACELDPEHAGHRHDLGLVLRLMARPADGERELLEATRLNPQLTSAWINLGNACRDQGKYEKAIAHFEQALTIEPDNAMAHTYLGVARLQTGQMELALQNLERGATLNPFDRTTMAYHAAALAENGRMGEARRLLDYDRLLGKHEAKAPAGFKSLDEFNQALAKHVADHPTLKYERKGNTTIKGQQTANLLESEPGPVAALRDIIDDAVREYFTGQEIDTSHPYAAWKPERWRYAMWGVILNSRGHQDPHIHPDAWLSGVYYVQLPSAVKAGKDDPQGWLEFGQPPERLNCLAEQPTHMLRPVEGTLFMFPSYFYHRTIPFDSEEQRISIAFDLRPLI